MEWSFASQTMNYGVLIGIATAVGGLVFGLLKFIDWLIEKNKLKNGKPTHWVDEKGENRILLRAEFDAGMADLDRKIQDIIRTQSVQADTLTQLLEYAKISDRLHDKTDVDGIPVWYFSQSLRKSILNITNLFEKESELILAALDRLDAIYEQLRDRK